MKKTIRNLILVMVVTVLCIVVAMTAGAATTEDGFTYTVNNGEVAITGYEGSAEDLIIPAEIDGYPLTTIGYQAFLRRSDLTGVLEIPESVKTIESSAFSYCSGLTGDLIIPESVTSIDVNAFFAAMVLTAIYISLKVLPRSAPTRFIIVVD